MRQLGSDHKWWQAIRRIANTRLPRRKPSERDISRFVARCLESYLGGGSEVDFLALTRKIDALGLNADDAGLTLYTSVCRSLLEDPSAEEVTGLSPRRQRRFLIWFSRVLFESKPNEWADNLHAIGAYFLVGGQPEFSLRALAFSIRIKRSIGAPPSTIVDSLTQQAVAADCLGRWDRVELLLNVARQWIDRYPTEPRVRDAVLRLSAIICAHCNDLEPALQALLNAELIAEDVYDAPAMRVNVAWTIAICNWNVWYRRDKQALLDIWKLALLDLESRSDPRDRWTEVAMRQHALNRTQRPYLSVLSNLLVVRMADTYPGLIDDSESIAIGRNNLGNAFLGVRWNERARGVFKFVCQMEEVDSVGYACKALQTQKMHAFGGIGFAHYNDAIEATELDAKLRAYEFAAQAFDQADSHRRASGSNAYFDGRIWACAGLANVSLMQKEKAWRQFARALLAGRENFGDVDDIGALEAFFNPESEVRAKVAEGLENLGAYHAAIVLAKAAVHAVHRESLPQFDASWSAEYVRARAAVHRRLARCLISVGRFNESDQAFAVLKEFTYSHFIHRSEVPPSIEAAVALTEAERRGVDDVDLLGILSFAAGERVDSDHETHVETLQTALASLDGAIAWQHEELASQRRVSRTGIADAGDLAPGVARLTYVVSTSSTMIVVTTDARRTTVSVSINLADLNHQVWSLRRACRSPSSTLHEHSAIANALFVALIEPVLPLLANVQHLELELDTPLDGIPFAALYDGNRYLVERFSLVCLAPAAQRSYSGDASIAHHPTAQVAVFACKELPGAALPGAGRELRAIESAMMNLHRDLRMLAFEDHCATTEQLLRQLQQPKQREHAIHVATHAYFNATNDALSALSLSDGDLSIRRLRRVLGEAGCELGLFVLSACGTGRKDMDVEGFCLTLLKAGVGSVISSLWETVDDSGAELFEKFYANCSSFSDVRAIADALRSAQIRLIQAETNAIDLKLAHPAHWSPFVMTSGTNTSRVNADCSKQ